MRRRDFITLLGGAAAAPSFLWPFAARAQQIPVIGWLSSRNSDADRPFLQVFRQALGSHGYADGRDVRFEYGFANGELDRLQALAADCEWRRLAPMLLRTAYPTPPTATELPNTVPLNTAPAKCSPTTARNSSEQL